MSTEAAAIMAENKLPDKPSDLIDLALDDLEACEADPGYKVKMIHWHFYNPKIDQCSVCLAGAVIAKTIGLPRSQSGLSVFELGLPDETTLKLIALNDFRQGCLMTGVSRLAAVYPAWLSPTIHDGHNVPSYGLDPIGFKAAMRENANKLRARGL